MPTGHYQRRPRVQRIQVVCPQCSKVREYTPGFMRMHPTIRFCSTRCAALSRKNPNTHVARVCGNCGKNFLKRRDHVRLVNFCSKGCFAASRRIENARWRDPSQIRDYMLVYRAKHRIKINAAEQARKKANRHKANEIQRKRRAKGGAFTAEHWSLILSVAPYCLKCGSVDRIEPDHIHSLARGGKNEPENIQPLCRSCNAGKGSRHIDYRTQEIKAKLFSACYPNLRISEI